MKDLRQRIEEILKPLADIEFEYANNIDTDEYVDKLEALIEEEKMKQHLETLENS